MGERPVLLVEGPMGWGECSPLVGYPCDPVMARRAADEAANLGWPNRARESVAVNALIDATPAVVEHAQWKRISEYSTVKVKVGRGTPRDDVERIAYVRDVVGPKVAIRIDVNGAWDVETAVSTLARLERFDLEFAEQPVVRMEDLAAVRRRVSVPIAADECVRTVSDAQRLRALAAADLVVLKVQPLGGVRAALAVADAAGMPAVVTSMMETSIGIAAGLALAAALPELPYACGLATLGEIVGDITTEPLVPQAGVLMVPAVFPPRPAVDLLARYAVPA